MSIFLAMRTVSLLVVLDRSSALEVRPRRQRGMVGMSLALGEEDCPVRAAGAGKRHRAAHESGRLREELGALGAAAGARCTAYAYAKLVQARQTAACNRFHEVEARSRAGC